MTSKKYLVYLACKPSECRLFEFSGYDDNIISFDLFESLKAFCGFSWAETVHTVYSSFSLLIDEQGKMKNDPVVNEFATELYYNLADCICGNCFLFREHFCDMAFLSESDLRLLSCRFPEFMEFPVSLWSFDDYHNE